MPDMLVRLYALPSPQPALERIAPDTEVRRARVPEREVLLAFVDRWFPVWRTEVEVAFSRVPLPCFVAVTRSAGDAAPAAERVQGFACHDVICRNVFGPMGVAPPAERRGIGRALLLTALHAQQSAGYAYAIIGGVGPEAFYAKAVKATTIPDSAPGFYAGMLRGR